MPGALQERVRAHSVGRNLRVLQIAGNSCSLFTSHHTQNTWGRGREDSMTLGLQTHTATGEGDVQRKGVTEIRATWPEG